MYADLVDAIAQDIEAYADLPEHTTQLYRRPLAIVPEDTPLLCVWVIGDTPNLEMGTTVTFDSTVTIGVSWHYEMVEEAQTMVRDDQTGIDALEVLERIRARIRFLSTDGISVGACHEVLPGVSSPNQIGLATGLVEGYATSVLCRIVES